MIILIQGFGKINRLIQVALHGISKIKNNLAKIKTLIFKAHSTLKNHLNYLSIFKCCIILFTRKNP